MTTDLDIETDSDPVVALAFAGDLVALAAKHYPDEKERAVALSDVFDTFLTNTGMEVELATLRRFDPAMASALDALGYPEEGDEEFDDE